jgi:hypothetical protein
MLRTFADVLLNIGFLDARVLAEVLGRWSKLLDQLRPDAVVCDYSPIALLAACCHGVPAVHLTNGFDAPPGSFPSFSDARSQGQSLESVGSGVKHLARVIHEASSALGRPRTLNEYLSWATKVHDGLPETDPYGVRPGIHHIGPITLEGANLPLEWAQSACGEGKRVFAYLRGPAASVLTVLESLKSAQVNVLCVWPDVPAAHQRRYRGDSIWIEKNPVNLTAALQCADAVVNYGSASVVASTLLAGKPQLMVPIDLEKHQLALRMQSQGLGLAWFPGQGAFRRSIDDLLHDAHLGATAQAVAAKYADGRLERVRCEMLDALVFRPRGLSPIPT